MERKQQIIESLLAKPTKKPDFSSFKGSDILKRAQQFMPKFIHETDRLLSDPELLKQSQMDIKVIEQNEDQQQQIDEEHEYEELVPGQTINMEIGVGMYDVLNDDFNEKTFKPSSTIPLVRIEGMEKSKGYKNDDDDGSDDSDLYYEFNSDDDKMEVDSHTTKATEPKNQKPLIVDITPKQTDKKTLDVNQKKNKKRNKRNH